MTTQTITQALSLSRVQAIRLPRINWKMFLMFGFCAILFFTVFYIFQVNELVRGTYLLKSYQKTIDSLTKEGKDLEINFAKVSYLENIKERTQELNFQKVGSIKYIQVVGGPVATAR